MKNHSLFRASAAAALALSLSLSLSAQTTTVDSVVGPEGGLVPSASGILNPRVVEGRFGTSLQGSYFGPTPNRPESRFSSNALYDYSGRFIGIVGDADAERAERAERGTQEDELSEIDRLMIMRYMRRQALAQQEAEEPTPLQQSAEPPAEPFLSPTSAEPAAQTAAAPAEPAAAPPSEAPPAVDAATVPPPEQIWMRGSARYTNAAPDRRSTAPPAPDEALMIDPRWFEFGADAPPREAPAENQTPPDAPFEEGTVIGGRLPEAAPAPAANYPSEALARNGRQEQARTAAAAQRLETRLLQSPLVSPLAPMHVRLEGTTAVVTGIVGSDAARVEAGKILLNDRSVETVDNRIVVYSEGGAAEGETPPAAPETPPAE